MAKAKVIANIKAGSKRAESSRTKSAAKEKTSTYTLSQKRIAKGRIRVVATPQRYAGPAATLIRLANEVNFKSPTCPSVARTVITPATLRKAIEIDQKPRSPAVRRLERTRKAAIGKVFNSGVRPGIGDDRASTTGEHKNSETKARTYSPDVGSKGREGGAQVAREV